eukprot:jgi/Chlat1/3616/Chrsp237S03611
MAAAAGAASASQATLCLLDLQLTPMTRSRTTTRSRPIRTSTLRPTTTIRTSTRTRTRPSWPRTGAAGAWAGSGQGPSSSSSSGGGGGLGLSNPLFDTWRANVAAGLASWRSAGLETWREGRVQPWDAAPRGWRDFWAMKVAAAAVQADAETKRLQVFELRLPSLDLPSSSQDWRDRVKTNLVCYRQNYAAVALAIGWLLALLRSPPTCLGITAGAVGIVCKSDNALGQVALLSERITGRNQLVWNNIVINGINRKNLINYTTFAAVYVLLGHLSHALHAASNALLWGGLFALAHASLRPITVRNAAGSFLNSVKVVNSSQDMTAKVASTLSMFGRMWQKARRAPVPVFVSVVGSKDADDNNNKKKKEHAEGAVDVEVVRQKSRPLLPPYS